MLCKHSAASATCTRPRFSSTCNPTRSRTEVAASNRASVVRKHFHVLVYQSTVAGGGSVWVYMLLVQHNARIRDCCGVLTCRPPVCCDANVIHSGSHLSRMCLCVDTVIPHQGYAEGCQLQAGIAGSWA
jgi:hypothetical protein